MSDHQQQKDKASSIDPAMLSDTPRGDLAGVSAGQSSGGTPSALENDKLIGIKIGNYEIEQLIGRGGFGAVYRARDTKLNRRAAIKFMLSKIEADHADMFVREAKIIANLSKHPNIVQIYEWGEHDGANYFVLEYLDRGADGLIRAQTDGLPVQAALQLALDCAKALEYAHKQGVLHRDIKPANILIDAESGRAKLCDFGLAKFHNLGLDASSGIIAGSPPYMSPEQAAGQRLTEQSDIFSLGVTLYQLLCGKMPVTGSSHWEVIDKIKQKKAVPLRERRPDLAPGVLELVEKATAFRPEDRHATAGEFAAHIQSLIHQFERTGTAADSGGPAPKPLKRSLIAVATGAVAVAAALLVFVLVGVDSASSASKVDAAIKAVDSANYTGAEEMLSSYLESNPPDSDLARYVLGYAYLKPGNSFKADKMFSGIGDVVLKTEGVAAVLSQREKDLSALSASLTAATATSKTDYMVVLNAWLALREARYDDVIKLLEPLANPQFNFRWQRAEMLKALGHAYKNTNNPEKALAVFRQLQGLNGVAVAAVAGKYVNVLEREMKKEDQAHIAEQIDKLKAQIDAGGAQTAWDGWTSRPLSVWVKALPQTTNLYAHEHDLVDWFQQDLASALTDQHLSIPQRDPGVFSDILAEQVLNASGLTDDANKTQLGRLVGARFLLSPQFPDKRDEIRLGLTDIETSAFVRLDAIPVAADTDTNALLTGAAKAIRTALDTKYPLQGRLIQRDGGLKINIGANVGVATGTIFDVFSNPQAAPAPDTSVTVVGAVGGSESTVELISEKKDTIMGLVSGEGLYVRLRPAQTSGEA